MIFEGAAANDILWVAKAKSKDHPDFLNKIWVEDDTIITTDNHRMHVVTPFKTDIEPGLYDIISSTPGKKPIVVLKRSDTQSFPHWKYIIPKDDPVDSIQVSNNDELEYWFMKLLKRNNRYLAVLFSHIRDALGKEIDFNQKMILIEVYKPDIHEFIYSFWTLYNPQTSTIFTEKRRISNQEEVKK